MKKQTIAWSDDEMACQKLSNLGVSALSDAELLGVVIGRGSVEHSATEIGQALLRAHQNHIVEIGKSPLIGLRRVKGIDLEQAMRLQATIELGRRMKSASQVEVESISNLDSIVALFHPLLGHLTHEELWVVYLTASNRIIEKVRLSHGGVMNSIFDTRLILKRGIELLASGILLVHNHPSGDPTPSESDISQTRRLIEAAKLLDMRIIDHVVVADRVCFSFLSKKLLG